MTYSNQQSGLGSCSNGNLTGGLTNCYPWQGQQSSSIVYLPSPSQEYPVKIRKAENGFVLAKDGKEYVFESVDSLLKHLKDELKK